MDRDAKVAIYLFFFLSAIFFMLSNGFPGGDSSVSVATCESLFRGEGFGLSEPIDFIDVKTDARLVKGIDGRYYSMFGLGWVLALIPFYATGSLLSRIFTLTEPGRIMSLATAMLQVIAVSGTATALYLFARRMGFGIRASMGLSLLYSFATTAFVYSKGEGIDYLNGLFVLGSFYYLYKYKLHRSRKDLLSSGFLIGFAISIKIADLLILPASILYIMALRLESKGWSGALRDGLIFLIWPIIFLAIISWYNTARFGAVYLTGYHTHIIRAYTLAPYPIYKGLYGFLFSPGRSVFLYNPPLILSLFGFAHFRKRFAPESNFILLATIPTLVAISGMLGWEGGYAWGPRYLAPFLAPWLLLSLPLIKRAFGSKRLLKAIAVIFIFGFLVQIPAVVMNYNFSYDLVRLTFYQDSPLSFWRDMAFRPGFSPLFNTYKILGRYIHSLSTGSAPYITIEGRILSLTTSHITPSPWIFQVYKLNYSTNVKQLAISIDIAFFLIAIFLFVRLYRYWRVNGR